MVSVKALRSIHRRNDRTVPTANTQAGGRNRELFSKKALSVVRF